MSKIIVAVLLVAASVSAQEVIRGTYAAFPVCNNNLPVWEREGIVTDSTEVKVGLEPQGAGNYIVRVRCSDEKGKWAWRIY